MSVAIPDNIHFILTQAGKDYVTTHKIMPINQVGLSKSAVMPDD